MAHPNEDLARRGYQAFSSGDMDTIRELFAPDVVFHVAGRTRWAGEHKGVDEVLQMFGEWSQMSGGSLKLDVHDVIANDDHVVALVTTSAERDGKSWEGRSVHVSHAQDGKLVEFWEHPQDQYALDEFWS